MSVGKAMKFQSSALAAESFRRSYERRTRKGKPKPALVVERCHCGSDKHAVCDTPLPNAHPYPVAPKPPKPPSPRVATPSKIGPDTLFVRVTVPIRTYRELLDHCVEFELTPQDFIKQALAAAKLSRGGV